MNEEKEEKEIKDETPKPFIDHEEFPKHQYGKPFGIMNHREKTIKKM